MAASAHWHDHCVTSHSRRLLVAINPEAAFGRNRGVGDAVLHRLAAAGHDVVALTAANFELVRRDTRAALVGGADALIVVGGDGMASLGVNLVAGTDVPLGIVPAGTGNDLARGLGIAIDDTDAATDLVLAALERRPRVIDAALATRGEQRTWFAGALSAGFDAAVNERANRMNRPKGPSRYTIAMVRELMGFRAIEYDLTIDGAKRTQRAMLVSVANNSSIGGGMRIVPHADLSDGMLDVFIVHPLSRFNLVRVFPRVFAGTHIDHPAVEFVRASRVTLNARRVVAYADGERIGPLPIDVEVVPGALNVLA